MKPDLVQGLGMPPYSLSLGYKKTIHLVTLRNYCHEDYPDKYGKLLGRILAFKDLRLIKKQVKNCKTFVTCSKSLSEIYQKKHGFDFAFIRNGVDTSKYSKGTNKDKFSIRENLNIDLNKKIFVYTGQIIDRKDQDFAIDGFLKANITNSMLYILGDGINRDNLMKKYCNASNVIFTGSVSNVEEYLAASDVYISTSKSEGLPNGVLEAMAVGLPVLLSDIPQHKEIFEVDENIGVLYKLGNLTSLIDSIRKVNDSNLNDMGEKKSYCSKKIIVCKINE